ncbi:hypothetical protein QYF61_005147 [Mycteria americana]|uniref:Uncharacterized protein n=1 Tax=Mycteria americana TaxID=33587 RepID=A0AAN7PQ43_MYCAM|nr:hypothetical protein QYF61_005147 [Mycteria americana]
MAAKGRLREIVGPLLIGAGNRMTEDMENAEVLKLFCLHFSLASFPPKFLRAEGETLAESAEVNQGDRARAHLRQVDIEKSTGTDEMYPRVLREHYEAPSLPSSWKPREAPDDWKKGNVTAIFKTVKEDDSEKLQAGWRHEAIARHTKERKVTQSSQLGFSKGKSCLPDLVAFYDGLRVLASVVYSPAGIHTGLMQFIVFTNDLDLWAGDHTWQVHRYKLRGVVNIVQSIAAIQSHSDRLEKWANTKCSKCKCKVLHLGWNNPMQ